MRPDAEARSVRQRLGLREQPGPGLLGEIVGDGPLEQLLPRIAVQRLCGRVGVEEGEGARVDDPDRLGVLLEEQALHLPGEARSGSGGGRRCPFSAVR